MPRGTSIGLIRRQRRRYLLGDEGCVSMSSFLLKVFAVNFNPSLVQVDRLLMFFLDIPEPFRIMVGTDVISLNLLFLQ